MAANNGATMKDTYGVMGGLPYDKPAASAPHQESKSYEVNGSYIPNYSPSSGTYPYSGTAPAPTPTPLLNICPKCGSAVNGPLASHFCLPMQGQTTSGYLCQKCGVYMVSGSPHFCVNKPKTTEIFFDVKIDCDEERLDRLLEKLERLAELREKLKT